MAGKSLPALRLCPSLALRRADGPCASLTQGGTHMLTRILALAAVLLSAAALGLYAEDTKKDDGWIVLFNGKDTTGWKLRAEKIKVQKFVDQDGKEIVGAKRGKVDQKEVAQDAKGKPIAGAKIVEKDGKKVVVDSDGKVIEKAKIGKTGGREAILDSKGKVIKVARAVEQIVNNPNGWTVEKEVLVCSKPHGGNDLLTEKKFTDCELHVEYQATSNSGVYLQGRYEIQVNSDFGKPTKNSCGSLYGQVAPSKNMNKKPPEWNTFHITFRAPRGKDGKVTEKGRITVVWNGEKVIDNAEIAGPTGGALDGKVLEPGPILLQGDHGKVSFRNIKIRPIESK
jgi:hypothetical protein